MTDQVRIDYLLGQVASLKAFCMCVCLLNERPTELQEKFLTFSELTVAKMLPTEASDEMLNGIENIKIALSKALEDSVKRKESRGTT